jgi:NCS1 family nucleobase:cation symporter-1
MTDTLRTGAVPTPPEDRPSRAPAGVEANGLNVIPERERHGRPAQLFWPWFGANISVLGLSYGSFVLGFGVSFVQATVVGVLGIVVSFLFCGFVAVAGKRGSAPTLVLSRAAFGVLGNRLPALVSWLLTVGWETVLTVLATLATATVFDRLGWASGAPTKIVALVLVAGLVILGGVMGFRVIMRLQLIITVVTGVLTVVFVLTGFGLGWVNASADYSRYLPRSASGSGVAGWTTFGASVAPVVLLVFGLLLAGSSTTLSTAVAADPVGALADLLPTWFLVPFVVVAVLGLVGASAMDIYSSGLSLLAVGLRLPRFAAALVDGVLMVVGTVYVVFFASDFIGQFMGFLITLGVPIAAWCGVMLADVALRRRAYDEVDLFDPRGRYGSVRGTAVATFVVATVLGWGLVTNASATWLTWQGYLMGPFGLGGRDGAWAYANVGVLAALVVGFVVTLLASRGRVRAQEAA